MNYFILVLCCLISAMAGYLIGVYVTYKSLKKIVRRKVVEILKQKNQDK